MNKSKRFGVLVLASCLTLPATLRWNVARAESLEARAASYLENKDAFGVDETSNWNRLEPEEQAVFIQDLLDVERRAADLIALRQRDHEAHVLTRVFVAPQPAQEKAAALFTAFVGRAANDASSDAGGQIARQFWTIARDAPGHVDFGSIARLPDDTSRVGLDHHLRSLARDFTAQLLTAVAAHHAPDDASAGVELKNTLRLITEAYALAGNTRGNYELVRQASITPFVNAGMAVGGMASLATVVMSVYFRDTLPAIYPVTGFLTMTAAYLTSATVVLREALIKRFDRPLWALNSRAILRHREEHVQTMIDRFWTYVGTEIERQADVDWRTGGDLKLWNGLVAAQALLGVPNGSAAAAARAVVRRRLLDLAGSESLASACQAMLAEPAARSQSSI